MVILPRVTGSLDHPALAVMLGLALVVIAILGLIAHSPLPNWPTSQLPAR
jgi:hypothetical protein